MKVKIGDTIYDSNEQPVMVILNEGEKRQISLMPTGINRYCQFPDNMNPLDIEKWMK